MCFFFQFEVLPATRTLTRTLTYPNCSVEAQGALQVRLAGWIAIDTG